MDNVCESNEAPMVQLNSPDGAFLIDAYEASRSNATASTEGNGVTLACNYRGTIPWGNVTYEDARNACMDAGKRLCTKAEWMAACGQVYPYGGSYADGKCTGPNANESSATGAKSSCKTSSGIFDMSGNVREWVEGGTLMGGAYNSTTADELKCGAAQSPQNYDTYSPNRGDGFRCCQDVALSQE